MIKWLAKIKSGEAGIALPAVLALLALGSLLIVPSLNYATTHLKTGNMVKGNLSGLYAADAGVEDALWRIKADQVETLPYTYELTGINGTSVNVTIEDVNEIAGVEIGEEGVHEGWLKISKSINYESGIYDFILSIQNNGGGNLKIEKILIDFPASLEYVEESTSGNITFDEPDIIGNPDVGITIYWDLPSPFFTIGAGDTEGQAFQLSGPPDVEGVEGHGVIKASREDVGTVWDADSKPYTIMAQAKDAEGQTVAAIRTGLWKGTNVEISCWQVNP